MSRPKPNCDALLAWLRSNLGRSALAPLTGTDAKALAAAVHILVVLKMQPTTRELAFHGTAFLMDWHNRAEIWIAAGLPDLALTSVCAGEPGGCRRE